MFNLRKNTIPISLICLALIGGCGGSDEEGGGGGQPAPTEKTNWEYNVGSLTYINYSSPTLSLDQQTIYIGTSKKIRSASSGDDRLLAISVEGNLKWEYQLPNGEEVRSTPVVYDNKIYFIADKRTGEFTKSYSELYTLDDSGNLLWQKRISDIPQMNSNGLTKVVAVDGKIISVMSHIRVYDAQSGEQLFEEAVCSDCAAGNRIEPDQYINPIVNSSNDVIFFIEGSYQILNLTDYTIEKISLPVLADGDQVLSTPSIDSQGNIYFGTDGADIAAIDASGVELWRYTLTKADIHDAPFFRSSPAIDEVNGSIYFGVKNNADSKFFALDLLTGDVKWDYLVGYDAFSSPLIGDNGNIYFGSREGSLYALKSNGELDWKEGVGGSVTWSSPTLDDQGMIYIGTSGDGEGNGKLIKIKTNSNGLLAGPWSKIHANSQNTGDKQ